MDKHSEKGMKTITLMGTAQDDWHLTPIKWQYVNMVVPVKVDCSDCRGYGRTYVNLESGKPAKDTTYQNINDRKEGGWKTKNVYQKCPTCDSGRDKRGHKSSGKVTIFKEQRVLVGTPVWAGGTLFDSRFEGKIYERDATASGKNVHSVCELCSKSITGTWSFRVPVQAKGADGRIHGMWVGQDCARKVLGVEVSLTPEQTKELKTSEYKRFIIKDNI